MDKNSSNILLLCYRRKIMQVWWWWQNSPNCLWFPVQVGLTGSLTHLITMSFTAQVASVESSRSVSFSGQTQEQQMSVAHWFANEGADIPGALKPTLCLYVLRVQCLLSAWTEDWAKQGVEWMYTLRNEFFCEPTTSLSALSVNQALDFQVSLRIPVTNNKASIATSYL